MSGWQISVLTGLAVLMFWAVGARNRLIKLRNKMQGHFVQLDLYLAHRMSLVNPLTEAAEAHAGLDSEVINATLAARSQARAALELVRAHPSEMGPLVSLAMAEQLLAAALTRLVSAMSANLAAHAPTSAEAANQWGHLSEELARVDGQIAFARQLFNTAVGAYNEAMAQWPTRWLTGVFRLHPSAPLSPEPQRNEPPRPH